MWGNQWKFKDECLIEDGTRNQERRLGSLRAPFRCRWLFRFSKLQFYFQTGHRLMALFNQRLSLKSITVVSRMHNFRYGTSSQLFHRILPISSKRLVRRARCWFLLSIIRAVVAGWAKFLSLFRLYSCSDIVSFSSCRFGIRTAFDLFVCTWFASYAQIRSH